MQPATGDTERRNRFEALRRECDGLLELEAGWDSYDAEPPNDIAVDNAKTLLGILYRHGGPMPIHIGPTVEGGIAVVFSPRPNYLDVECYNDGDVLLGRTRSDGRAEVHALALPDTTEVLRRLREPLDV
ncbi:hypothetical protein HS125_20005 [bacterium]|nr:hypothetical protein [bacterium]